MHCMSNPCQMLLSALTSSVRGMQEACYIQFPDCMFMPCCRVQDGLSTPCSRTHLPGSLPSSCMRSVLVEASSYATRYDHFASATEGLQALVIHCMACLQTTLLHYQVGRMRYVQTSQHAVCVVPAAVLAVIRLYGASCSHFSCEHNPQDTVHQVG